MKTVLSMNDMIVSSELTMDDLIKIAEFKPEKLTKVDPETSEAIFRIGISKTAYIGKYGVSFNETTNDGKAAFRVALHGQTVEERKREIATKYGYALQELKQIENQLIGLSAQIDTELNSIESEITVIA